MASTAPGARSGAWLWFLVAGALLTQTALNLVRPVTTYKLLSLDADSVTVGLVTAAYAVLPLATAEGARHPLEALLAFVLLAGCVSVRLVAAPAEEAALAPMLERLVAAGTVVQVSEQKAAA